ncbi:jacalin-like lectin domain-containing protein [Artemisia annua]|uniref:Jacalin-like lectin domain-containing protein n=1 Tax=Artemisia annua TaxID=35608 RepID=A0A2U1NVK5_ARTAN|nr:jacalin-like lectin domain-containing protein [Artemisia annua]
MAQMIKLGRRVTKGSVWDEGGKSDIVQILISHQPDYIKSIQFLYNSNGVGSLSEVHGEHTGTKFNTIVLDHAAEFLTSGYGLQVSVSDGYLRSDII